MSDKASDTVGPLGLNILYLPPAPVLDLIFVHGLRGGSRKTWSKTSNASSYWPKAWLPRDPDFEDVRIHSFGYNSDWGSTKDSVLNVHDFGKYLLSEIINSPDIMRDCEIPLVLVGHSMGGLVIKQTHILAKQDPSSKLLADRIYGMIFLATPHRGAGLANMLGNILKISVFHGSKPFIADLERNSVALSLINDEFRHYSTDLELVSFYETLETSLGLSSALIVNKDSATLGYPNEKSTLLNANHRDICKFNSTSDPNYISLRNVLATMTMKAKQRDLTAKSHRHRAQLLELYKFLELSELPEEDLNVLENEKMEGSCQWITAKETFLTWRDGQQGALPYYWLRGPQGAGKSTVATHIVRHLEAMHIECCYYFFKHNDKVKASLGAGLRALAYQMALARPAILKRLLAVKEENHTLETASELTIWRKIFLNGILVEPFDRPFFWVIDGLDECNGQLSIVSLLGKINRNIPLRVFMLSHPTSALVSDFLQLTSLTVFDDVTVEDTHGDIEHIVHRGINRLPFHDNGHYRGLSETILGKASGSFLWVTLVLEELQSAFSMTDVENILRDVPQGMDPLYERALEMMSRINRGKHLIKAVLRWAVCAIRPLSLEEMTVTLELETGEALFSLEKFIASSCWHFIQVKKNGKVSLTHETARAFLLRKDLCSEFVVDEATGHGMIADICLQYLEGDEMRQPQSYKLMKAHHTKVSKRSIFASYACENFSQHLCQSKSNDSRFNTLCRFLSTNVLSWIEHIAETKNLQLLVQTGRDMKIFLKAQVRLNSVSGGDARLVDNWGSDLAHVVARFGDRLTLYPSAIFWLIPPFCPPSSAIGSHSVSGADRITFNRCQPLEWSDRISSISYSGLKTTALACGGDNFAVGFSDNTIKIYSLSTCLQVFQLNSLEFPRLLVFNASGSFLACASRNYITLYNPDSAKEIWQAPLHQSCLSISFSNRDKILWLVTPAGVLRSLSMSDGVEISSVFLEEPTFDNFKTAFGGVFHTAAFTPDFTMVAVAKRGRPVRVHDMRDGSWLQDFTRGDVNFDSQDQMTTPILDVLFIPESSHTLMAILYHDGELVVSDLSQRKPQAAVDSGGCLLACSPDGHLLAVGDFDKNIRVFDSRSLTMLLKIYARSFYLEGLSFSPDGLRILDIRRNQCNVWKPSIFIGKEFSRQIDTFHGICDTIASVDRKEMDERPFITCLACHSSVGLVLCGKENGDIALYSAITGKELQVVSHHGLGIPITLVTCGFSSEYAVSVSPSRQCVVWRIVKVDSGWQLDGPILDIYHHGWPVKQVIISPTGKHLLVSSAGSDTIYEIETGRILSSVTRKEEKWWLCQPRDPDALIDMADRAMLTTYLWNDISVRDSGTAPAQGWRDFMTSPEGCELMRSITEWESRAIQRERVLVNLFSPDYNVAGIVKHLIGSFRGLILFLDWQMWVCSLDPKTFVDKYQRHFFIPDDWTNSRPELLLRITFEGNFVFVDRGDITIIKNALNYREVVTVTPK